MRGDNGDKVMRAKATLPDGRTIEWETHADGTHFTFETRNPVSPQTKRAPTMKGDVLAVVGGQYGSEGKGVIVNHIADRFNVHVRVGGPNAGHSFYHKGRLWKMQQVPCGWTNPNAQLIIGRGALIDPKQMAKEIREIQEVDPTIADRIFVDARAGVVSPEHSLEAGGTAGEAHKRYGSTGKGVGVARIARLSRKPGRFKHFYEVADQFDLDALVTHDTPVTLALAVQRGQHVLLEGTQGFGLSLIHGPWPYTTNHDTTAAQLAADAGVAPNLVNRILMVLRTYPIRVHGNSGPMKGELTWEEMSAKVGRPVEEKTTVTNLTRRIGEWDDQLFYAASIVNQPTSLAIMFMDYLCPETEGITEFESLSERAQKFVGYLERYSEVPVAFVGTGGDGFKVVDRGMRP